MPRWSRLAPLVLFVGVAVAGLAMGAQFQHEDALPGGVRSQQLAGERSAAGNVVALTGIVAAAGVTGAVWALGRGRVPAPPRPWLGLGATFLGAWLAVNLLQTAYPNYASLTAGSDRQAVLHVNLLASQAAAVPSALVPVFAAWVGALYLLVWGARRTLHAAPRSAPLLQRHVGTLLVAAPFLALAAAGSLRLMVALPPVPGTTLYRVLLSLASLAFLGLLCAGAAKAWQLRRAARDGRVAPLALEAWEGLGRVEAGIAGLLVLLALAGLLLPAFPPPAPQCAPIDPRATLPCPAGDPAVQYHGDLQALAALLRTGRTFGMPLHVHFALLLAALVPLAPMVAIHRAGLRALDGRAEGRAPPGGPVRPARGWTPTLAAALAAALALAFAASFAWTDTLWGWVLASLPTAAAAAVLAGPARHVQAALLAAWASWGLGNSLSAAYGAQQGLQFASDPSVSWLLRLAGAVLAAWAVVRLARAPGPMRPSTAIPLAGAAGIATVAVALLELPLAIWTNTWDARLATGEAPTAFVGTEVARADLAAAVTVHLLCLALAVAAAVMAARALRPDWFGRGGGAVAADGRPTASLSPGAA